MAKNIRILALIAISAMLVSLFAACKEDSTVAEVSSVAAASDAISQEPTVQIEQWESDSLGSYDFGGMTIKIGSIDDAYLFPEASETAIDEHKREIVENVAERFNVKLEPVTLTYTKFAEEVLPDLLAGELVAHIIMPVIWEAGQLISAGVCQDMASESFSPYINFDNPWWDSTMAYASTINGATYCATPNFVSAMSTTFVMYFNKDIAAELKITDLYDLEKNNQWTWDKFREYAKSAISDLNGDGEYTLEDDRWGFLAPEYDSICAFVTSAACRSIEVDPATKVATYALNTPRNITVLSTLNDIYVNDRIYTFTPAVDSMNKYFIEGKTLFASYQVEYLKKDEMRDMSDDFGVLLMPMGPDQTTYMSRADHNTSCVVIPTTNSDAEELKATAIVLEGLAFATWKQGVPDLIDLYSTQYIDDDDSAWAIENVFNCTTFETSQFLYMITSKADSRNWAGIVESAVQQSIIVQNPDISGNVTSIAEIAQQFIDDLWAEKVIE